MRAETVSVIVPTFNRARYLAECLDSLVSQTVAAHEIIVVDDGSQDNTRDVVARYGDKIRYVSKANAGKPSAVNLGLDLCSGSLIWLFDDDDVALPDAIEQRLAVLSAAPAADLVYSGHYLGTDGADGRIVRGRSYSPEPPQPEAFFLELMRNCFFSLCSALVRRECYAAVGGLDPTLLNGEDYDLAIRLARVAEPAFCAAPSFIVRQHEGARGATAIRYRASERRRTFRRYSALVGRKVRRDVPLGEFLVPRQHGPLEPPSLRTALLNRCHVMANHGCIPELFEDLHALLEARPGYAPLTDSESSQLATAMRTGYAYEASTEDWREFVQQVQRLKNLPAGTPAIRALAKGLLALAKSYPGTLRERTDKARRALQIFFESYR